MYLVNRGRIRWEKPIPFVRWQTTKQKKELERELIVSVLSTAPSPREARKFLNSTNPSIQQRLGALLCVDAQLDPGSYHRAGKLLAQMQRIDVAPIVITNNQGQNHSDVIRGVHELANAVEREGGSRARPICESVFYTNPYAIKDGAVTVDTDAILLSAIQSNVVPIVAPLVADPQLRLHTIDAKRKAVPAMAQALVNRNQLSLNIARLVLLGSEPGIISDNNEVQRFVNLEEDYGKLEGSETLELMRTCLGILPPTSTGIVASVCSDPGIIMKGLMSEKPPPPLMANSKSSQFTLLRHGFRIHRYRFLDKPLSLPQLRSLLERSFGRKLDGGRYFERLRQECHSFEIIVAGNYQGAVIVTYERCPHTNRLLPYLDKFAVSPDVQGTGMADILWEQLKQTCPGCMWRSRTDNAVNKWYFDRSHGHCRGKSGKWVFFWYSGGTDGLTNKKEEWTAEMVNEGVEVAENIPASFISN